MFNPLPLPLRAYKRQECAGGNRLAGSAGQGFHAESADTAAGPNRRTASGRAEPPTNPPPDDPPPPLSMSSEFGFREHCPRPFEGSLCDGPYIPVVCPRRKGAVYSKEK